jgi:hypothetical protein
MIRLLQLLIKAIRKEGNPLKEIDMFKEVVRPDPMVEATQLEVLEMMISL